MKFVNSEIPSGLLTGIPTGKAAGCNE